MSRCRSCNTIRTKGDPCPNAACPRNTGQTTRLRSRTKAITLNVKHGYHAPNTTTCLVADYDLPIRARSWRSAR